MKALFQDAMPKFYALLFGTKAERDKQQHNLVEDPKVKPWSAICYLRSSFVGENEKGVTHGTGFLISDTTVITAAHNLCKLSDEGTTKPQKITITLAGNASEAIATRFDYDPRYPEFLELLQKNNKLIKSNQLTEKEVQDIKNKFHAFEDPGYYDYGAIFLDKPLEPKPDFFFKLRGADTRDPLWDRPMVCAGYPGDHAYQLYCAEGAAHPDAVGRFMGNQSFLVVHNVFASGGQSGGPLYVVDDHGEYVALGIFVRSNEGEKVGGRVVYTNGSVRISKDMESLFMRWDEDNKRRINKQGPQDLIA